MKALELFTSFVVGFALGMVAMAVILTAAGRLDQPADSYTVAELTDAIATREANFAERAVELEGKSNVLE